MTKHYLEPGTEVWSDARFILGDKGEHIFDCISESGESTVYVEEKDDYLPIGFDAEVGQWYWED